MEETEQGERRQMMMMEDTKPIIERGSLRCRVYLERYY